MLDRISHWETYYRSVEVPVAPSQFGVFVHNEFPSAKLIVDVGCGSGRDTFFFAQHGHRTIGVDASEAAVSSCRERAGKVENIRFLHMTVGDQQFVSALTEEAGEVPSSTVFYARFFIHAISEREQSSFLRHAASFLPKGGVLAVEFRTLRDREQSKVTPAHYRRFVDPLAFIAEAAFFGFSHEYFVEGFGYAKHKNDDAHVARTIMRQNRSA
jgi:SAM-dependent methyltransferase